jgi:hypothetical protein
MENQKKIGKEQKSSSWFKKLFSKKSIKENIQDWILGVLLAVFVASIIITCYRFGAGKELAKVFFIGGLVFILNGIINLLYGAWQLRK